MIEIKRGDIFLARLDPAIGTETKKTRPVIIISDDIINNYANRIIGVPVSSNVSKIYEHIELKIDSLKIPSKVMVDQIKTLDKSRLIRKIGEISEIENIKLNEILKFVLKIS